MQVSFRIPYPPSANTYWRHVVINRSVRVLLSKRGREYRASVQAAIAKRFGKLRPASSRLRIAIVATMPDRRTRDLDNLLKATHDALTHASVWGDDSQIDEIRLTRGSVQSPGWLDVTLEVIPDPQARLFEKQESAG